MKELLYFIWWSYHHAIPLCPTATILIYLWFRMHSMLLMLIIIVLSICCEMKLISSTHHWLVIEIVIRIKST